MAWVRHCRCRQTSCLHIRSILRWNAWLIPSKLRVHKFKTQNSKQTKTHWQPDTAENAPQKMIGEQKERKNGVASPFDLDRSVAQPNSSILSIMSLSEETTRQYLLGYFVVSTYCGRPRATGRTWTAEGAGEDARKGEREGKVHRRWHMYVTV